MSLVGWLLLAAGMVAYLWLALRALYPRQQHCLMCGALLNRRGWERLRAPFCDDDWTCFLTWRERRWPSSS